MAREEGGITKFNYYCLIQLTKNDENLCYHKLSNLSANDNNLKEIRGDMER